MKKYVLVVLVAVVMVLTACSLESKEGVSDTEPANTEPVNAEFTSTEPSEPKFAESDEKEDLDALEIPQGDPIVAVVDKYEDNIIVARDVDDGDIIYYFSTKDAEVIEGDSPIAAGDIVEITYRGVQGDEEHPGTAVKIVAESEMYK